MTLEYIIEKGKLTQQEISHIRRLHVTGLDLSSIMRCEISYSSEETNNHLYHSSLPVFTYSSLDSESIKIPEMKRLNRHEKRPDNSFPRRRFGVYAFPDCQIVLRSPVVDNLLEDGSISVDSIDNYLNPGLIREVALRDYLAKNLNLPVVEPVFLIQVQNPKGLLLEAQEKGQPFKFLHHGPEKEYAILQKESEKERI